MITVAEAHLRAEDEDAYLFDVLISMKDVTFKQTEYDESSCWIPKSNCIWHKGTLQVDEECLQSLEQVMTEDQGVDRLEIVRA